MAALSGQRTLAQLRSVIGAVLFEQTAPSASTYPTADSIDDKVNEVYRDVFAKRTWWWAYGEATINATANNKLLTMPDTVERIWGMQIQGINQPIRYVPRNRLLLGYPGGWNQVGASQPIYWTDAAPASNNALQVNLFPEPNSAYTITYQYQPRLTVLTSALYSIIPPEFEDVLVFGALSDLLSQLSDQRAPFYQQKFDKLMNSMWMRQEETLDGAVSAMDASDTQVQGWPGLVQPYIR